MADPVLRILSYLPNPRVWKALITAELCGVQVEVIGDKAAIIGAWLWDYDARKLRDDERTSDSPHARVSRRGFSGTLFKTESFLEAHPFGTVPAAFGPEGQVGIFESNSIMRAVARAGAHNRQLYGRDGFEASRIDGFLDANLVFAREAQVYLLAMDNPGAAAHERMAAAYEFYLAGVERALRQSDYLAGESLSIADISFVCDLAQFLREGHYEKALTNAKLPLISRDGPDDYPHAYCHMLRLNEIDAFAQHMGTYLNWYRKQRAGQLQMLLGEGPETTP